MNTLYVYAYLGFTPELYAELGPDYFLQNQHFKIAFKSGMVRYGQVWAASLVLATFCYNVKKMRDFGWVNQSNQTRDQSLFCNFVCW